MTSEGESVATSNRSLTVPAPGVSDDHVAECKDIASSGERCAIQRSTTTRGTDSQVGSDLGDGAGQVRAGPVRLSNAQTLIQYSMPLFRKGLDGIAAGCFFGAELT